MQQTRNALFTLLFAIVGAFGLAAIWNHAHAYDNVRIDVDLGDVGFAFGQPCHHHDRTPLYVAYARYHQPRYSPHAPRRVYRSGHYEPYSGDRVIVRPRVVHRNPDYGYGYDYRDHHHPNDNYRDGHRDRYWVDRNGRRHSYRH